MKYPRINKKKLDTVNQKRFDSLFWTLKDSIGRDCKENQLKLSKGDIHILAWNAATIIISQPY